MEEFLKEYVYFELSSTLYEYDSSIESDTFGDRFVEIDGGRTGIWANLLGTKLSWEFEGRYKARRSLPRSKYRRLKKRVDKRFRKLLKEYKSE